MNVGGAIHNHRHAKPLTRQTLDKQYQDTPNLRHIKPQTKNIGLSTTPQIKMPFCNSIMFFCVFLKFVISCFKKCKVLVGHITLTLFLEKSENPIYFQVFQIGFQLKYEKVF